MSEIDKLDLIFPFVLFAYGFVMTLVVSSTELISLAERTFPEKIVEQLKANATLGHICLIIGFFWSLQTLVL